VVRGCRAEADARGNPYSSPLTLSELVEEYLGQHVAEANTIQALRDRLKVAVAGIR
jgi:hypothetical protein